jgi:hypothetical protein
MERHQQNLVAARPELQPESAPPRRAQRPASGAQIFEDPHDSRTEAYVTGRIG